MQSRHESLPPRLVFGVAVALVCAATMPTAQAPPPPAAVPTAVPTAGPKGTLERIKVFGKSLEGNLEGDSPDRDVVVYLPPSYAKETGRRYPVVYFLHGYSVGVEAYVRMLALPEAPDRAMGSGAVREAILVLPDAFTKYSGSMYSNSLTTGDSGKLRRRRFGHVHRPHVSDDGHSGQSRALRDIRWGATAPCGSA